MTNLLFLNLSTGMVLILVALLLVVGFGLFLTACYLFWSEPDRLGGPIFFIKAKENMAYFVMFGNKLHKVILASMSTAVDSNFDVKTFDELIVDTLKKRHGDEWKLLFGDLSESEINDIKNKSRQKSFLGMYWIGLWPLFKLHTFHLVWQEWKLMPKDPSKPNGEQTQTLITRDVVGIGLPIKSLNFGMFTEAAEDKNQLSFNLGSDLIIIVRNLQKMMFLNIDVYDQLRNIVTTTITEFIKMESFHSIGGENTDSEHLVKDRFSDAVCALNQKIPGRTDGKGLIEALGIEILSAKMQSPDPVGGRSEKLFDASTLEYIAIENKKAKIVTADADLYVAQKQAEGKKASLDVEADFLKRLSTLPPSVVKVEERKATPGLTTIVENKGDGKTDILISGGR